MGQKFHKASLLSGTKDDIVCFKRGNTLVDLFKDNIKMTEVGCILNCCVVSRSN